MLSSSKLLVTVLNRKEPNINKPLNIFHCGNKVEREKIKAVEEERTNKITMEK